MHAGWPRRIERDSYRRTWRVSQSLQVEPVRADSAVRCCWCLAAVASAAAVAAVVVAAAAATRPRLRRLGNQVEPRASRAGYGARRRVGEEHVEGVPGRHLASERWRAERSLAASDVGDCPDATATARFSSVNTRALSGAHRIVYIIVREYVDTS
ncbi:hypothetical protein G5I_08510 [Acromyrmex echinatior]|uniref:Uncharacterized protein n=1 Tax=Acromyrmex echinatior TaxID=103372 RepID=F4WRQ7_ACREC|nr:hypothetical protein G5I_08510 [Acromyrmex echinatior]